MQPICANCARCHATLNLDEILAGDGVAFEQVVVTLPHGLSPLDVIAVEMRLLSAPGLEIVLDSKSAQGFEIATSTTTPMKGEVGAVPVAVAA